MMYVSATPLAGCLVLIALAALIGIFLLPFVLKILPFLLLVLVLWWFFGPKPVPMRYDADDPDAPPEPAPGDDIPASEAVIDVEARVVEESKDPSDNNHIGG